METKGEKERLDLFDLYSTNAQHFASRQDRVFYCPICRVGFIQAAVRGTQPIVNLGHVFPDAGGGTKTTLECSACNNRLNAVADNELVKRVAQWKKIRSGEEPSLLGRLVTRSGKLDVHFGLAEGVKHGRIYETPETAKQFQEAMSLHAAGVSQKITFASTDNDRIGLAYLHSAHLLLFREFGYAYLSTPLGSRIAADLHRLNSLPEPYHLESNVEPDWPDFFKPFSVFLCVTSERVKHLAVCLPSPDPTVRGQLVSLPGPSGEDQEAFKAVLARAESWTSCTYMAVGEGRRVHLRQPEFQFRLEMLWIGWTPSDITKSAFVNAIHVAGLKSERRTVDASQIAKRLELSVAQRNLYISELVKEELIERRPKSKRPHLVRITKAACDRARQKYFRRATGTVAL